MIIIDKIQKIEEDKKKVVVYLYGFRDVFEIPGCVAEHLQNIVKETNGDVTFVMADSKGVDEAYHKCISSLGLVDKAKVYAISAVVSNRFELPVNTLRLEFDEQASVITVHDDESNKVLGELLDAKSAGEAFYRSELYEIRERHLAEICDFAICLTDGKDKAAARVSTMLRVRGKYIFMYTVA